MAKIRRLVVVVHVDRADTRWLQSYADERKMSFDVVRPYAGEPLPALGVGMAVVCLGGPMAAYDDLPFIRSETAFLGTAVQVGIPVLGICLGSQLLARGLGGDVFPAATGPEVGFIDVVATQVASSELARMTGGTHFSFHWDTMRPPMAAEVIARSDRCLQVWRLGSALAIQYHPELSVPGLQEFFDIEADKLAGTGLDAAAAMKELADSEPLRRVRFYELADAWLRASGSAPVGTTATSAPVSTP